MSYTDFLQFVVLACFGAAAMLAAPRPDIGGVFPAADEVDERLATDEDIRATCAEFDEMLVGKGLLTGDQLDLIRHGRKAQAVVTGMRPTGTAREDFREVELAVMVLRLGGGQFPAHEKALIPVSSLRKVYPGSVIDTYYRPGDESAIAVCVPPS
ncbi:hypothetical protein [Mycobacterium sp.]|uniref:hypothetical protein n=1 Tax=Mycobacterium sp. TaxID=1785 RepID=UPI002D976773|nr:hypothetical protein [Mycobacterium sp.]